MAIQLRRARQAAAAELKRAVKGILIGLAISYVLITIAQEIHVGLLKREYTEEEKAYLRSLNLEFHDDPRAVEINNPKPSQPQAASPPE